MVIQKVFLISVLKSNYKVFIKKEVVPKDSKKEPICTLPFTGKKSLQLRTRLVNSIENNLKFCKLKRYFTITMETEFGVLL